LRGVGTLGVVACGQEVAVTPGELLADADLIHACWALPGRMRRRRSARRREQQRREDAKKELANSKLGGGFGFTCTVKVSDFGDMASVALFSAFASSRLRCSTAASK
jgi:hypothetical protein